MKRALLMLSCLAGFELMAQEKPSHTPRAYVDEAHNYYQQAALPVYIFLSNTPNKEDAKRLKEENGAKEPTPIFLDGHGLHYIRHKDNLEQREILFEVYADGIAPVSRLKLAGTKLYARQGKPFYGSGLQLTLTAEDEMSGVDQLFYSLNGQPYVPYKEDLHLKEAGHYSLSYYAVDKVGNVESTQSTSFTIDASAPTTALRTEGDRQAAFLAGNARIMLTAEDEGAGIAAISYSLDGQKARIYRGPISMAGLSDGKHTLTYFATDQVNNQEEAREWEFVLDRKAPVIEQKILGKSFEANGKTYFSGDTHLELTAHDDAAGVKAIYYSVNGEPFKLYTEPFLISQKEQQVNVRAYGIDQVNNKGSWENNQLESKTVAVGIMDFRGPELSFSLQGPVFQSRDSLFISASTKIELQGKDEGSGMNLISYAVDGKEAIDYSAPFQLSEAGVHEIRVKGFDNLLNESDVRYTLITDVQGPEIFPRLSTAPIGKRDTETGKLDVYPKHVVLFLSATDQTAGFDRIYYRINGGSEQEYKGIIRGFAEGELVTLEIRAIDLLGNELTQEYAFAIEGEGTLVRQ